MTQFCACILHLWKGAVRGREGMRGKGERKHEMVNGDLGNLGI